MTPEERNLVTELFDRLAALEDAPRDREAERLIQDGLRQAPNALYALVQTALLQEAAIKSAEARIRALEAGSAAEPPRRGGFLDSGRNSPWVSAETPRPGSVPTVRPPVAPTPPQYRAEAQPTGAAPGPAAGAPPPAGGGGSFLGTAAAAAVGMIGGSLLASSLGSMMGHKGGTARAASDPAGGGSAWGNSGSGGGDLARQAGLDDIGRGNGGRGEAGGSRGLFDSDPAGAVPPEENDGGNYIDSDEDLGDLGADLGDDE